MRYSSKPSRKGYNEETISNCAYAVFIDVTILSYFFRIFKWGNTYNIYSFLKVWIVFDGSFAEVVPAPSTKGNHCGLCGNYNRNKYDEMMMKDGTSLAATPAEMVTEYCWK